jgi:hypothetical protein
LAIVERMRGPPKEKEMKEMETTFRVLQGAKKS